MPLTCSSSAIAEPLDFIGATTKATSKQEFTFASFHRQRIIQINHGACHRDVITRDIGPYVHRVYSKCSVGHLTVSSSASIDIIHHTAMCESYDTPVAIWVQL